MELYEVKERITKAYLAFIENDFYLLQVDVNERSMTHKLAEYLQHFFPEYDVDCEYNKIMQQDKKLYTWNKKINILVDELTEIDNTIERKKCIYKILEYGISVYPDIIIHHRGSSDNFIVIEAKKTNNLGNDIDKLSSFKRDLHYQYAVFVQFPVKKLLTQFTVSACDDYIEFVDPEE